MSISDENLLKNYSNFEIFWCLKYTKNILNDKSGVLMDAFFIDEYNSEISKLGSILTQEEKKQQLIKIYLQYLTEFNWRNRN